MSPTQRVPTEALASTSTAQTASSNPLALPSMSPTQRVPTEALASSNAAQPPSSSPLELPSVSPTQSVPTEALASSSAAQPAFSNPLELPSGGPQLLEEPGQWERVMAAQARYQDEQRAAARTVTFENVDAAPSLILPSPETPLYNALLEKLSTTDDENVMESLADFCVFDKLKFKKPYGSAEQPADKSDDTLAREGLQK